MGRAQDDFWRWGEPWGHFGGMGKALGVFSGADLTGCGPCEVALGGRHAQAGSGELSPGAEPTHFGDTRAPDPVVAQPPCHTTGHPTRISSRLGEGIKPGLT